MQPLLSSSYAGWGTASLTTDVDEIAQLIHYLKIQRPGGAIVLVSSLPACIPPLFWRIHTGPSTSKADADSPLLKLGHSTGCQDALHYLIGPLQPHGQSVSNGNAGEVAA